MKPYWYYFYAGQIERGRHYEWKQGYSRLMPDGSTQFPWVTRREAQSAAKSAKARACFFGCKQSAMDAIEERGESDET